MNKIQRIIIKLKCIQWKAWMTIFTIVCSVGVLGITKCTYEMKTWIELVVIPMLISFLMGVCMYEFAKLQRKISFKEGI